MVHVPLPSVLSNLRAKPLRPSVGSSPGSKIDHEGQIVVTKDVVKPAAIKQPQAFARLRSAVDQVANRDKPISLG